MIRVRPSAAKGVERANGSFLKLTESNAMARVELVSLIRTRGLSLVVWALAVTTEIAQAMSRRITHRIIDFATTRRHKKH
jgi:hypothetical protein